MRCFFGVMLVCFLIVIRASSILADPVDLHDKKGVVDPSTLKSSDPKPPPVHTTPPPPPEVPQHPQPTNPVAGVRG